MEKVQTKKVKHECNTKRVKNVKHEENMKNERNNDTVKECNKKKKAK